MRMSFEDMKHPFDFTIETSNKCNLNCIMCARRFHNIQNNKKEWSLEEFKFVIDNLGFADLIQIGGNQEVLCYKYFKEAYSYLSQKGIPTYFTTNGVALKEPYDYLPYNSGLFISIDGGTEDEYREIRGYSLNMVLNNIIELLKKRKDISIALHSILFKHNIQGLHNLVIFCMKYDISIRFLYPIFFTKKMEREYSPFTKGDINPEIARLDDFCNHNGVNYALSSIGMFPRGCTVPFQSGMIGNNGDEYICCWLYTIRNSIKKDWKVFYHGTEIIVPQEQYKMGNIFKQPFIEMWNSPKYIHLRKTLKEINSNWLKNERFSKTPEDDFWKLMDQYDPNEEHSFCKICLQRWCRVAY